MIAQFTDATRVVAFTNLHNPTSAPADPVAITAISEAARAIGAWVFIDEVYLELRARAGRRRRPPCAPQGNVIVTGSLTKAYGLSGLRCGWILAPADLAERMRRLNDLHAVVAPHVAERLSVLAFDRLDALRVRASALLDQNRAAYRAILGGHPKLDQVIFDHRHHRASRG